ncbi:hypothetical protein ACPPVW_10765 [Leifsonia sp. McL0607]|uniref:hypothetical protein n=1 Tax=Leifsonia sp. McL0607 TaxID=3415672 RepID=UPI003CF9711D
MTARADSSVGSAACDSSARQKWEYVSSTKAYKNVGTGQCVGAFGSGAPVSGLTVSL